MRSYVRRLAWFVLGSLLFITGIALTAHPISAHAFLQRTQPASGTVVAAGIGEVRLTFNERVEVRPNQLLVTDGNGRRVDRGDAQLAAGDPLSVVVSLPQLPVGVYTARYAFVSSDTHPISGEFRFGVGVSPADLLAGASPTQTTALDAPLLLQAVGRGLNLLGLIVLIGPIFFLLFILTSPWARDAASFGAAARLYVARGVRWAWVAVAILIAGQVVALLGASLASTFGSFADALQPSNLLGTLTGRFGTLWLGRLALLLVPALALPVIGAELELGAAPPATERVAPELQDPAPDPSTPEREHRGWWTILLAGVASALLTAIGGHAATTAPVPLSIAVDWVHLLAAGLWIGGLLTLVLVLPGLLRALSDVERLATLAGVVPRFSTLALGCVQALALTGFYQTWVHVDGPTTLGATLYGRTLLVKLLLLIPLAALAAVSRLVFLPRLRAATAAHVAGETALPTRRYWRALWGEAALGIVVLAVVGLLTALPPARAVASASESGADNAAAPATTESVTIAGAAGTTLVDLTIGPTGSGPAVLSVTLRDPGGATIDNATVTLRLTPPDGGTPQDVPLTARGGRFTGLGDLARVGAWQIVANVTPRGGAAAQATFALDLPTGGARTILARSDLAMNRLTSLSERQMIGAGGPATTTYYQWAAPDRLRLRSDAGSETIIIGTQRYDRTSGNWIPSAWPDPGGYRWPIYEYARTAAEVTLLRRETIEGVPCWVLSFLDTPSGGRMTLWIGEGDGLVRRQQMFAVGHYMESVFSDFNAPATITAP
ncbi:MAG TPA: copper resistance protein CopC [Thermomicrobiales bacterium]